jgi:hypothetical protein
VLREIFVPKKGITGGWRKLPEEGIRTFTFYHLKLG